jgi:hypothetical protein
VEVVRGLIDEGKTHPSPKAIADGLEIGRSATYDRIRDALRRGYLVNEAGQHERGMKLAIGAELPAAGEDFLPSSTELVRLMSTELSGQNFGSTMRDCVSSSGCPARPATPGLGDDGYAMLLSDRLAYRHINKREWRERLRLHEAVRAA